MSRDLSDSMLAAVAAQNVAPAFICTMDFASGFLRVWSGVGDLVWNGQLYIGAGIYGGVSEIEETKKASANGLQLSLTGIPSAMVALALTENYRGRRVYLWLALFDPVTGNMLADPTRVFAGRMDTMKIADNGSVSTVTMTCESRLIDLERARERRYTHEDQQALFPGDKGLANVAALQNKEVFWGRWGN
jgi:hypothetical protein